MWRTRLLSSLAVLAILAPTTAIAEEPTAPAAHAGVAVAVASPSAATQVVDSLQVALIDAMKNADSLGYQGRFDRLAPVVRESFDLHFMAEKSVGRHWKTLEAADRERWLESFVRLTTANYAGRFNAYSGQAFAILGEEPAAHGTLVVRTKLVQPDDDDIQLNYRLRETEAGWQIVDVYLNGTVSELALRRSEYSSVLKRDGFETLLAQLDQKATDLANGVVQ